MTIIFAMALAAADPGTATSLQQETRSRIEAEVRSYLSTICPAQCELSEVNVKVAPRKPSAGTTPGFEETSPDVKDYVVTSVDLGVTIDKRLPGEFRTNMKTLIERRLKGEGYNATVHETLLKMPLPQDLPEKPPMPIPIMQQQQQPAQQPERPAERPLMAAAEPNGWQRFWDMLPLLLGLILCAAVVGYTLRQYARLLEHRADKEEAAKKAAVAATSPLAKLENKQLDKDLAALSDKVTQSPSLRREVFRTWLREGPIDELAGAVAILGAGVLSEVRSDPECEEGLSELDAHLAQVETEPTTESKQRMVAQLRRRVLRAEVRREGGSLGDSIAKLATADEGAFVQALAAEDEVVQAALLRHVPERLQRAAFATRSPNDQARLVRALVAPEACSRERLLDAAERISAQTAGQSAGATARQARQAAQLLESADAPERRRILAALRSGDAVVYRAVLGQLVTEETLATVPGEVLGAALLRIDIGQSALALNELNPVVRKRVLAALPTQQAQAIEDEAEALAASPQRRETALRAVLAEVRKAASERGVDLYEVNERAWQPRASDEEAIA
jgi:flagellar motor switch protein FliG